MLTEDEDDLRSRFRRAAIELYTSQGYERTTAAQIARAVGVTSRTFNRYYADKRDVLFEGEAAVRSLLVAAIGSAPEEMGPLDAVLRALGLFRSVLEAFGPFAMLRDRIMRASAPLREREALRTKALIDTLAAALVTRGADPRTAAFAARVGMAAFVLAAHTWFDSEGKTTLGDELERTFGEVRTLLAGLD